MTFTPTPEVVEQIDRQYHALVARVEGSHLYTHEIPEFALARAAYSEVAGGLGVVEDLGSLTTPESRNLVRKVRLEDGTLGVLKIMGNNREPGEGRWLEAQADRGLPCPRPLAHGVRSIETAAGERETTYLLTPFVEAPTIGDRPASTLTEKRSLAVELTQFLAQFHNSGAEIAGARRWEERLGLHLQWTLPLIRRYGLKEPAGWRDALHDLSEQGDAPLHGDAAGNNVLDPPGGKILIDPPGALRGLPEADAAQICCQVGGAAHVRECIESVCAADPSLDRIKVEAFAGFNFLTWAGYPLADHPNPDVKASAAPEAGARRVALRTAREYVDLAHTLIQPFTLAQQRRGPAAAERLVS